MWIKKIFAIISILLSISLTACKDFKEERVINSEEQMSADIKESEGDIHAKTNFDELIKDVESMQLKNDDKAGLDGYYYEKTEYINNIVGNTRLKDIVIEVGKVDVSVVYNDGEWSSSSKINEDMVLICGLFFNNYSRNDELIHLILTNWDLISSYSVSDEVIEKYSDQFKTKDSFSAFEKQSLDNKLNEHFQRFADQIIEITHNEHITLNEAQKLVHDKKQTEYFKTFPFYLCPGYYG